LNIGRSDRRLVIGWYISVAYNENGCDVNTENFDSLTKENLNYTPSSVREMYRLACLGNNSIITRANSRMVSKGV